MSGGRPRLYSVDHNSTFSRIRSAEAVGCSELESRRISMEIGSRDLHRALWREHTPILKRLAEQDLLVVRP